MAINKNFVIKNGLEVNTNVLVAASDESQVGVGTTRPYYKLHVGGGEGNRGGIGATDITITGIATIGVANSDSGAFNVLGISTFKGDIDLIGSAGISTVRWDASKDGLIFQDNATARFGTGEDLRIWHDGSNSYISDQGTGSLIIYGTDETLAVFTDDGSVQLYNNDNKVFETTGLGVTTYGDSIVSGVTTSARLKVTGISTFIDDVDFDSKIRFDESESALTFIDNAAIRVGTGSDFSIQHDGTQTILTTQGGTKPLHIKADPIHFIKAGSTEEYYAKFTADNAVELYFDNTKRLATTAIGATVFGDFIASGVGTFGKAYVTGFSTFAGDVDFLGGNGATWDTSEKAFKLGDDVAIRVGTGSDFSILHNGNDTLLRQTGIGGIRIDSPQTILRAADDEYYLEAIQNKGVGVYFNHLKRFETIGFGASVLGNLVISGVNTTGDGNVNIGGATTVGGALTVTGNAYFNGDVNIAGDIVYDELTGRNLNITGITTLADQVNFGTSGAASTIAKNGNATFSGIVTASQFQGGGIGVGIGSTTAHVGYGFTYLDLKGPGVSTVYASATTGITTIYFQGGGGSGVGAAGTWQNDGSQGISTAKSVGINTVGVAVTALMGGVKGASSGIGASMQGLYIGNGMLLNDNQLNGNHYIGTAFGGIMAGPVTVNGVVTVDGNWAVV